MTPTHEAMMTNIENTLNLGTQAQIDKGLMWYLNGNMVISDIADKYSFKMTNVAAAMAHLSPRIQWTSNVRACDHLCATGERRSGIMVRSWAMACTGLLAADPLATLNGPKVRAFYHNLLLIDMNMVTIDVWALRAAGVEGIDIKRVGAYARVEAAYQAVADKVGMAPARLQASAWVITKDNWKRSK